MRPRPPRRGFSLVEVIVSLVISMIIFSTVTTIMVNTLSQGKRARAKGEMARDGALVAQLFNQELRQTGLGVPNGTNINAAYGSVANTSFYASLLVAGATEVGVLGDIARADANYTAYGALHARELSAGGDHVVWHTENNGPCAADSLAPASGSCSTAVTSLFFPGEAGCNGVGAFGDRTCPWGLRRVVGGERIVIVSGDGRWSVAALGSTIENVGPNAIFAARLGTPYAPGTWPSSIAGVTGPGQIPGQGWVTTLDRVFFRYDAATRTIQRNHCRGDPDPTHVSFPGPTATAIPATLTSTPPGGAATTCSGFEIVARNVDSLTFTYFDKDNVAVPVRNTGSLKRSVRRIAYRIEFRDTIDGRDITHDVGGSVRLQNL